MEIEKHHIKKEIKRTNDSIINLFVVAKIQSGDEDLLQMIRDLRTKMFEIEDKVNELFK